MARYRTRLGLVLSITLMVGLVGGVRAAIGSTRPVAPRFTPPVQLSGASGDTEPRVTIDAKGNRWVITNAGSSAVVYGSKSGTAWTRTPASPADQTLPTIDTEIVTTRTGRIIVADLDFGGVNFRISYSDDGGKTWTKSQGGEFVDTDRPFMAVGPDDPTTHEPTVYLLWHNLVSGEGDHNMYVQRSIDGGATFLPPVPTAPPGSQAFLDLQCADSGGPSNIFVNQRTGQVYAVFGTRSAAVAGGCQAAAGQPQLNVVAATRVWVVTSSDGGLTWSQSLAVDDSVPGNIVGMQLAPGAVDSAGNVYVFYPESPHPYPAYEGAALKYVWAKGDLKTWSKPITVVKGGGGGNLLPHIAVGSPGKIDFAYFHGVVFGTTTLWYATMSQTLNGLAAKPRFTQVRLSPNPTYNWTARHMMGYCAGGIADGLTCERSTDVWGVALDPKCLLTVTWPSDASGGLAGTWVATQKSGSSVC